MQNATHDRAIKQALRIRRHCRSGAEGCSAVVARLLDHDPPLSDRQRETLIGAAVALGRYGLGCPRCFTEIRNMPEDVRAAYVDKYGEIPPACATCKDSRIFQGLVCLACREVEK
mgnify:CR=1 FL=1